MAGGGQPNNTNATKGKPWRDAIQWALDNYEKEGVVARNMALRTIATKLVENALEGKLDAQKELGDRIEGKATQAVQLSGHLSTSEMSTEELIAHYKELTSP